jgi:RNA polymerase sigma-70 factor, ECF subfamily
MPQEPQPRPDADDVLVGRMIAGDRDAFAALFRRHERTVYRFALQMTGSAHLADDVTQEVFMALARGGSRYVPAQGALGTYLYGVARNIVRQHEKRRRARQEVDLEAIGPQEAATAPDPVDQLTRQRSIAALRRAILRLPPHYREVIVLCELHALSYDETAIVIGCPVGTVRSRLNRARRLLSDRCRASLEESGPAGHWPRVLSGVSR